MLKMYLISCILLSTVKSGEVPHKNKRQHIRRTQHNAKKETRPQIHIQEDKKKQA
jgi:hypothetical protein